MLGMRTTLRAPGLQRRATATLRESVESGQHNNVDRERGIIRNVKVLGRDSPNSHNIEGADRTEYTPQAIADAIRIYEGMMVNCNHAKRSDPDADRDVDDRLGKLFGLHEAADGVYGNLKVLRKHPMAERLFEAAEEMPDAFALSHNAKGQYEVRNGVAYITSIPYARSVDLVADGGSVQTLFESREPRRGVKRMKNPKATFAGKKLKSVLESLTAPRNKRKLAALMEADVVGQDAMVGDAPPPLPPPEEAGGDMPEANTNDHLSNAIITLLADSGMPPEKIKDKVNAIMDLMHEDTPSPAPSDAPSDAIDIPESDDEDEDDDLEDVEMKESREFRKIKARVKVLEEEKRIVSLCESMRAPIPDEVMLKALLPLDEKGRRSLIERTNMRGGARSVQANYMQGAGAGANGAASKHAIDEFLS